MNDQKKVRRRRAPSKTTSKKATRKNLSKTQVKKSATKKTSKKKLGRRFKFGKEDQTEKHVVTLVMKKGSMAKYMKAKEAKSKSKAIYKGMSEELGFEVG